MSGQLIWVVDGNNVMGSRADGWWNNRPRAMARLAQEIAEWCRTHDDPLVLVFDGRSHEAVSQLSGGNLTIRFAERSARNAADDVIVELVELVASDGAGEQADSDQAIRVVSADRGLRARLPDGVDHLGPRTFLELLTNPPGPLPDGR